VKTVGICSLQGDFVKHAEVLAALDTNFIYVRSKSELHGIDGIILPGGESTTIGKLLDRFSLLDPLKKLIQEGLPVMATCAGAILLAQEIEGSDQLRLGTLDITVKRNAYGPQGESFETDIDVPSLGSFPVRGIFIRAPLITRLGKHVKVLARFEENPVLVQERRILAATFHPELAGELRIHKYFIESI
jgi:pyridoxal 5'-phosphate synthase pdxT subunit